MLNKVRAAIKDFAMFSGGEEITVALSGGADSMALLYALLELSDEYNLKISAAHLNHMLRGEEALRDAQFVKKECARLKIPLEERSIDVAAFAKEYGLSTELAARQVRYAFLKECSKSLIATAHTASDNLETVIMNLTRGTGIKGLCGIPPVRENYIRPLIYVTRAEVEQYCKEKVIDYVTDSSNLTDDYTRNVIRHKIVPVLKDINPLVEQSVTDTSRLLTQDNMFINDTAKICFNNTYKNGVLHTEELVELPTAVLSRVLRIFCEREGIQGTDSGHIKTLCDMVQKGFGRAVLPGKTTVELNKSALSVAKDSTEETVKFTVELTKTEIEKQQNVNNLFLKNAIDCDKIVGNIEIRTRKEGDEITLVGRGLTKSLKKLFNEEKIPLELRNIIPVISDDAGVIWVYGIGVNSRVAVGSKTKNIYIVNTIKE